MHLNQWILWSWTSRGIRFWSFVDSNLVCQSRFKCKLVQLLIDGGRLERCPRLSPLGYHCLGEKPPSMKRWLCTREEKQEVWRRQNINEEELWADRHTITEPINLRISHRPNALNYRLYFKHLIIDHHVISVNVILRKRLPSWKVFLNFNFCFDSYFKFHFLIVVFISIISSLISDHHVISDTKSLLFWEKTSPWTFFFIFIFISFHHHHHFSLT